MPQVPIQNSFGEVSYGAAVPFVAEDYTKEIMSNIQKNREAEDKALAEMAAKKAKIKAAQDKYSKDLNKIILTQDKNILPMHRKEYKASAYGLIDRMKEQKAADPNYDPENDSELSKLVYDLSGQADQWQQEKKKVDEAGIISLDQKKKGRYEVNYKALEYAYQDDPEAFYKEIAKFHTGDENNASKFPIYGGVGILRTKDTTDIYSAIKKDAETLTPDDIQTVIGDISHRTKKYTQEEKEQIADKFYMPTKGQQLMESFMAQQEGSGLYPDPVRAREYVRGSFVDRIPDLDHYKKSGGQGLNISVGGGGISDKKTYFNITPDGNVAFGSPGPSGLPSNIFKIGGKATVGKPTGEIKNKGTIDNPNLVMLADVYEPNPKFTGNRTVEQFMELYPVEQYAKFYTKKEVPQEIQLTGNEWNSQKWRGEYGFGNTKTADQAYSDAKKSLGQPSYKTSSGAITKKLALSNYDAPTQKKIRAVMDANGIDEETAIKELIKAGKLK